MVFKVRLRKRCAFRSVSKINKLFKVSIRDKTVVRVVKTKLNQPQSVINESLNIIILMEIKMMVFENSEKWTKITGQNILTF